MADLRTLAQAFADAMPLTAAYYRHRAALADALDGAVPTQHVARAILAVYAHGYARAMGEVIAHSSQRDRECEAGRWDPHAAGQQYAWEECWEWARERAAAVNR